MSARDSFNSSLDLFKTILSEVQQQRADNVRQCDKILGEVKELREETAEVKGGVIALEGRQKATESVLKEWQDSIDQKLIGIESMLTTQHEDIERHKATDARWQQEKELELNAIRRDLNSVIPLARQHEQIVQQATGAVRASKTLYAGIACIATAVVTFFASVVIPLLK